MDKLLEKFNIDANTLNAAELATLDDWAQKLKATQITLDDVKGYIKSMIDVLVRELAGEEYPKTFTQKLFRKRRETHLKARLYNYTLLYDFLTAPDKAKSYVEKHLNSLKPN